MEQLSLNQKRATSADKGPPDIERMKLYRRVELRFEYTSKGFTNRILTPVRAPGES